MTTAAVNGNEHDSGAGIGTRRLDGADIRYRVGSVDEVVLEDQYHAQRFFAAGYDARATDIILDVGAHIGVFTVLAAHRVPRGAVYALEPEIENFGLLSTNIDGNGLTNATAHRVALSGVNGTIRLYHAPASWGHSVHYNPGWATVEPEAPRAGAGSAATFEDVAALTLEEFLAVNGIRFVNYMKMNIEGAEYDIFAQTRSEVLASIGFMHIEMHHADDEVVQAFLDKIRAAGFSVEVDWSDNPHVKGWLTARLR